MKIWSGQGKIFHNWTTAARSVNEDHFAMGITFAIANQKRARNVKRSIITLDTALLFIKIGWIICHRHSRRAHRLQVSIDHRLYSSYLCVDSLVSTTNYTSLVASPSIIKNNLHTTAIRHFIARKPNRGCAVNRQWRNTLEAWSTFDPRYLAHFVM